MALVILLLWLSAGITTCIFFMLDTKKKNMERRNDMTLKEIHCSYFKDVDYSVFEGLWLEIASTLHIPYQRIRPTDRFGKELASAFGDDWDMDALTHKAISRMKNLSNKDYASQIAKLEKVRTVDDYIRTFGDLIENKCKDGDEC